MYKVVYTKRSDKDKVKLKHSNLDKKAKQIIALLKENPYKNPPPYEKLVGDLQGAYSRRINIQHRVVYEVIEQPFEEDEFSYKGYVKILKMWTHYE